MRLRRMPFNVQGLESNGRVWRGVLERGPDVGTRIVCGEPLLPTAIVATCEVSPEEERRDGHKEEGRAGRECQIWGTWTHRSKGEKQKASGVVRVSQCWVGVPPATCQVIYCCIAALETA